MMVRDMRSFSARVVSWCCAALLLAASLPAAAQERIGVGLDLWTEGSALSGEQSINNSRIDQSFDYGAAGASGSAWLLFSARERIRAGPGIRLYGNYGSGNNPEFIFGFLSEAFVMGEYSLNAIEKFDAIFGGRAGVAVLVPGADLAQEITRLRDEGVDVWNVPRLGWLAGLNVGTRRQMSEKLWLRLDINAQYQQLYLFATDQIVDDLRFQKRWNTNTIRLGLLLGVELAL